MPITKGFLLIIYCAGSVMTRQKRCKNILKSAQDANMKGEDKKCQTGLEESSSGGG